jgi:valyl-tRNA synthetase
VVTKLCNLSELTYVDEKVEDALSFILHSTEFYIPLTESVDIEAEIAKLEEELRYTEGFLKSVEKKLSNERFVNNAPEQVVAMERKKQEDAQNKIAVIREQLISLRH